VDEHAHTLREKTQDYWDQRWPVKRYLAELLPGEIQFAKQEKRLSPREPGKGVDWLVLLVGFAREPLLQSVCAYRPRNVLLVLNNRYGGSPGATFGRELKEHIQELAKVSSLGEWVDREPPCVFPEGMKPVGERPEQVFRFLRQELLPKLRRMPPAKIVLDITGAKKSMVAGAYLFGAYANIDMSYVDFDDYDEERARPYGYTCRPGLLANPYELFRLRDWQRARELYGQYAFRSARAVLQGIIAAAQRPIEQVAGAEPLFSSGEVEAMRTLDSVLEVYERWDNGDLRGAEERSRALRGLAGPFQPPTAVAELHNLWPPADLNDLRTLFEDYLPALERGPQEPGLPRDLTRSLYLGDRPLLAYAHDELAKIERLIQRNEDNRSALIRAAGLHETLITARVLRLWEDGELYFIIDGSPRLRGDLGSEQQKEADKRLLREPGVRVMVEGLRWQGVTPSGLALYRKPAAQRLAEFWNGLGIDCEQFAALRNKASHFCLSVSKEIAEKAWGVAKKNLEDFQDNWGSAGVAGQPFETKSLPWDELCALCGIDFLPPELERTSR
jgi:hypothetical protein